MFQSTGSVACLWTGNLMKKRSRLNTFLSQRDENRRKESHDFSKCQKCPEKQKSIPKNFVRQAKSVFFRGENLKEGLKTFLKEIIGYRGCFHYNFAKVNRTTFIIFILKSISQSIRLIEKLFSRFLSRFKIFKISKNLSRSNFWLN